MTKQEIQALLQSCLPAESASYQPPSRDEWQAIERRFGCEFPEEMRHFVDAMAAFSFPGDILNVGDGPHNGNDTIDLTYDIEFRENPSWEKEMVPFYSIGNGDYFCVSSAEAATSAVYYFYADRSEFSLYCGRFSDWLKQLPTFLA